MGSIGQLTAMIPGMSQATAQVPEEQQEAQLKKAEAIIQSMTPQERANPSIIGGSRRKRIARGSGTHTHDINQLLNQFAQMQKIMKMGAAGKLPRNMMGMFGK
jgi:signal recognition particle subunit SRP54